MVFPRRLEARKMSSMATTADTALLDRMLEPVSGCLTPQVARRIVRLRADPAVQRKIVSATTFLAILQSKARIFLAAESRR